MKSITLNKKKIVELNIGGIECIATLDTLAINHFQITNNIGLLKAMKKMKNKDLNIIYKLLCSLIREKESNKILGYEFFKDYDDLDVIEQLMPVIDEIFPDNLPEAKKKEETKEEIDEIDIDYAYFLARTILKWSDADFWDSSLRFLYKQLDIYEESNKPKKEKNTIATKEESKKYKVLK